jgi:hypothetical protein
MNTEYGILYYRKGILMHVQDGKILLRGLEGNVLLIAAPIRRRNSNPDISAPSHPT